MKKTTTKSYALRIDGPLVKPLQELKKQNRRSLNAEINAALEAWVATASQNQATTNHSRARSHSKRKRAGAEAEATPQRRPEAAAADEASPHAETRPAVTAEPGSEVSPERAAADEAAP